MKDSFREGKRKQGKGREGRTGKTGERDGK
jgi:hypothetical protein